MTDLETIERQLTAWRDRVQPAPVPPEEIGPWLWNEAWARAAIGRERDDPSPFAAWRIGEWAMRMPADVRAAAFDQAIDAFEALIPTPAGPGNDAGPFCMIAEHLSAEQARRALGIARRMRGWGAEADAAVVTLAERLGALGRVDERNAALAGVTLDGWIQAPPPRPDRRACLVEWNALHPTATDLSGPRAAMLLRAISGQPAIDRLRRTLLVRSPREAIEARIDAIVASPDPRLRWHLDVVRAERFLPLHLGWLTTLGVRPDGSFVRWDHEHPAQPLLPLADPSLQRLAICMGARRYPELAELVPPRPAGVETCETCGGVGTPRGAAGIVCVCEGSGWVIRGEPRGAV